MATTAPGSPYVESSDLVANYPAVSEALAERVDTVGVLPFASSTARGTAIPSPTEGQYSYLQDTNATEYWDGSAWVAAGVAPGLVHINTTTFSAVSSVSLDDVFTSDYDNYRMIVSNLSGSGTLSARVRASGTDANTSYIIRSTVSGDSSFQAGRINNGSSFDTQIGLTGAAGSCQFILDILGPQKAVYTAITFSVMAIGSTSSGSLGMGVGCHYTASAYDGISILATSLTGTIRVYGYKNGA